MKSLNSTNNIKLAQWGPVYPLSCYPDSFWQFFDESDGQIDESDGLGIFFISVLQYTYV